MLENHIYYPYGSPEDDRPTICTCDACRNEILGRKGSYFGEAFYAFPNGDNVHVNCLSEWANNYSVDGSDDEALCCKCNEDQREYLYYVIDDDIVCQDCLEEYAEEYINDAYV